MAFKLPFITSSIPNDLRAFCDRVREALTGTGPDRLVTRRDLIATGVVTAGPAGTLLPPAPDIEFGTPPAPTGLAASGAIANIILTWDAPNYAGHSHTEIFFADTNIFENRQKLADTPGAVYSHSVGAATTKYYWIRFVNVNDVKGPFNSTTGVAGTTGQDPAYLLDVLTGSITSSELSAALASEITTNTTEITNVRNLYTVKMDNNGFVTGFGLMSTLADGGVATSDFFTNVNRFAVTAPMTTVPLWAPSTVYSVGAAVRISGNNARLLVCKIAGTSGGSTPSVAGAIGSTVTDSTITWQVASSVPIAVLSTSLTANGVTLAPGVYIDGATIVNATIGNAQIANASIDDAKITTLDATKITTGFLNAARIQAGSIDVTKVNFTVVGTTNVVGTINASTEGIRISGNRIQIDGNVTFSAGYDPTTKIAAGGAAADVNANVTTISGGKITTGSITADKINVTNLIVENLQTSTSGQRVEITKTNNDLRVYNSSGTLIAQIGGTGLGASVKATSTTLVGPAVWGVNTGASGVFGEVTTGTGVLGRATTGEGVFGNATSSGYGVLGKSVSGECVRGEATTAGGGNHGVRGLNLNGNGAGQNTAGLIGAANGFDFYADGTGTNYGPFTGSHDALTDPNHNFVVGDIVIDSQVLRRNGISSTITIVETSSEANQKAAIGVVCALPHPFENNIPAVYMEGFDEETGDPIPTADWETDKALYNLMAVNSVGEGQINVCGEGGDIEAGDLIVTSSLPGKGMKQSDDIVRAITVAKSRESVTFSSPTEVKQVACIYLCG